MSSAFRGRLFQTTFMSCAIAGAVLVSSRPALAQDDRDEDIEVSIFAGSSIDSFAAADLRKYINPENSGNFHEQLIAGFDFDYRVTSAGSTQVWLYGETIHGARSGEVDCTQDGNDETDVCKIARLETPSPQAALAIFRKATTLEGFVGLRAEFGTIGGTAKSKFYVKGQLGFLSVADKGGDIVDMHHVGVGLILTNGLMRDSYFEIAYGRNDLFQRNDRRKKVDGFLTFSPRNAAGEEPKARPFFQICIDSDFASGPDNIQTYFGLDIDVLNLFR